MGACNICRRVHNANQPCPTRMTNALMMRPQGLEQLEEVDRAWLRDYPVDVYDIVEEELANRM